MKNFAEIEKIAAGRHGGRAALQKLLTRPKSLTAFKKISDQKILAGMTRIIFQAGFVWKIIDQKWSGFEEAFHNFEIDKNASLTDKKLQILGQDERIVRNRQKIDTVRRNARLIKSIQKEYGSAANFLAGWPLEDQIGLFDYFKEYGARLGGTSGAYFLRRLGLDVFLLTPDVIAALIAFGPLQKAPTSKKLRKEAQVAFNQWHKESNRPYTHISKILACSIDA